MEEIQSKILAETRHLDKLARMIGRMPECLSRRQLVIQHTATLTRLIDLYDTKGFVYPESCDFGFTDKCPGYHCSLCPHGLKIIQ